MRNSLKLLAALAAIAPGLASATQIGTTKHNLAASGTGTIHFTDQSDPCVFCHQPHNTVSAAGAPLWARKSPTGAAWTAATTTLAGTALPTSNSTIDAPSQRCLSCHDGTVALNVITNSQGTASTVASNLASGASSYTTALATNQFALNTVGSTTFTNLTGQHPVGIPFPGSTTSLGASKADPTQFGTVATTGCIAGVPTCVTGGAASTAGAYIYLYGTAGAYSVECASCHNPHQDNVSGLTPHFLRVPSSISGGTCGACHIK